jgi:transposase
MKTDAVDSEKIAWSLKRDELTGIYKYKENFSMLSSVPGFGLITSMSMLTEFDNNPMRFPNERKFVAML